MYDVTKISKRNNTCENASKSVCKKGSSIKAVIEIIMIIMSFYVLSKGYTMSTFILAMIVIFSSLFDGIFE